MRKRKHLWQMTMEEIEKDIDEYINSKPKMELLLNLLEAGFTLYEIDPDFISEAFSEFIQRTEGTKEHPKWMLSKYPNDFTVDKGVAA